MHHVCKMEGFLRLRIYFRSNEPFTLIWNYQQYFNMAWNKLVKQMHFENNISSEMKAFLKNISRDNLYCFSKLMVYGNKDYRTSEFGIENVTNCFIVFSTPFENISLKEINEHFLNKKFLFIQNNQPVELVIEKIVRLNERLKSNKFTCISPVVVLDKKDKKKKRCSEYSFDEKDASFIKFLKKDLLNKFYKFYGKTLSEEIDFEFYFDKDYISKRKKNISKLIKYESVNFKGYEAPFTLHAPLEIIEIAYKCGIGDNNNIGFGCIEKVQK